MVAPFKHRTKKWKPTPIAASYLPRAILCPLAARGVAERGVGGEVYFAEGEVKEDDVKGVDGFGFAGYSY